MSDTRELDREKAGECSGFYPCLCTHGPLHCQECGKDLPEHLFVQASKLRALKESES